MEYAQIVGITACINLDRRPDRWEQMRVQFEREGMAAHRISGIDGRMALPLLGELPMETDHLPPEVIWNPDAAGRMASFVQALSVARWTKARSLLYFHDDALLPVNFKTMLTRVMRTVPWDWDVINFGPWHLKPPQHWPGDWYRCNFALNIHALLISSRCYDAILAACHTYRGNPDWILASAGYLNMYSPRTLWVSQREGWSDVLNKWVTVDEGRAAVGIEAADPDRIPSGLARLEIRRWCQDADLRVVDEVCRRNAYQFAEAALGFRPTRIVDAGGHIGAFAWVVFENVPEAGLAVVEPDPRNLQLLMGNIRHYQGAKVFACALWYGDSHVKLRSSVFADTPESGASFVYGAPQDFQTAYLDRVGFKEHEQIPTVTLADIMRDRGWDQIDLLKIDIEGAEWNVFENGYEDFSKVRVVVGEYHGRSRFDAIRKDERFADWRWEILENHGDTGIFRGTNLTMSSHAAGDRVADDTSPFGRSRSNIPR